MSGVGSGEHVVVARASEDHVPASTAADEVGTLAGRDRIGAGMADGDVVSCEGDDAVVAGCADQRIGLRRAVPDHARLSVSASSSSSRPPLARLVILVRRFGFFLVVLVRLIGFELGRHHARR